MVAINRIKYIKAIDFMLLLPLPGSSPYSTSHFYFFRPNDTNNNISNNGNNIDIIIIFPIFILRAVSGRFEKLQKNVMEFFSP